MENTLKKMKIVIFVLSSLLVLSLVALTYVIIFGSRNPSSGYASVTNNYIVPDNNADTDTSSKVTQIYGNANILRVNKPHTDLLAAFFKTWEPDITIYKNHAEDSEPFNCPNMFPGDSETKTYLVKVSHSGRITVRFRADIRKGYEKLAEVLKCKVLLREENKVLYDGLMVDMPESINHQISSISKAQTKLTYDITVYLETSVGNEYMGTELVADFRWWVEEKGSDPDDPGFPWWDTDASTDSLPHGDTTSSPITETKDPAITSESTDPNDSTYSGDTTEPDDGQLEAPQTGDNFRFVILMLAVTLSLLIILLMPKKRYTEEKGEYKNK